VHGIVWPKKKLSKLCLCRETLLFWGAFAAPSNTLCLRFQFEPVWFLVSMSRIFMRSYLDHRSAWNSLTQEKLSKLCLCRETSLFCAAFAAPSNTLCLWFQFEPVWFLVSMSMIILGPWKCMEESDPRKDFPNFVFAGKHHCFVLPLQFDPTKWSLFQFELLLFLFSSA